MSQRNVSIDRIRVILTVLVILHHTAITYGAQGGWYFKEPRVVSLATALLTIFCTINQSFFMGFFFLLAGYFTPGSLERKGLRDFVIDRVVRLGVPLVVYGYLIGPATEALASTAQGAPFLSNWVARLSRAEFENGPLWFAQALLIFTAVYCVWRGIKTRLARSAAPRGLAERAAGSAGHWVLALGALGVGAAAFLIRLVIPVGQNVFGLQWAYFASYVFLFGLGCAAAKASRLEKVTPGFARPWIGLSIVVLPLFFAYAILSGVLHGVPFESRGGLTLPALAYAIWEPLVAWGIILAFLSRIHRPLGATRRALGHLAPLAYGAYIVHPPLLVGSALLVHSWDAPPLVKFALVAVVAIVASFLVSAVLRRIPGVARIV
jgi:surface polysaccharide O-acyltransferase-like enzyme